MVGFAATGKEPTVAVKFFSAGAAASIADMITFPLDVAKVRLQIQGEGSVSTKTTSIIAKSAANPKYRGMFGTILTIARQEGPRSLYNGLCAGLQRQMAFASIRIGLYDSVKNFYTKSLNGTSSNGNVGIRILAGITTGGMAVVCAQPTDVVKVRMQAQSSTGPKRYTGTIQAYRTIGKEEGVKGLWKGTFPNVARNGIINAAELVCYDSIKDFILKRRWMTDNAPCHFTAAFGAGFCATVVASPVDVVKTRFMNSRQGQYTGAIHCARKMFKEGGFFAFYKGFMPSFIRLGSWNICMFVTFEQLKRLFTYLGQKADTPLALPPLPRNASFPPVAVVLLAEPQPQAVAAATTEAAFPPHPTVNQFDV